MPRKPKSEPMTTEMMIVEAREKRATSKLYKAENQQVSNEAISKSIRNALFNIKRAEHTIKVDLNDIESVRAVTGAYLESCAVESCFPSMTGLAMALGYTRRNLNYYMNNNHDTETGKFLIQVHDLLADILSENALKGNANNITSIFLLKALYGLKETDNISLEVVQQAQYDEPEYTTGYKEKYKKMINLIKE